MGLTDVNKNTKFINKRMGKGRRESEWTHLRKVGNFKQILRNKMNEENIDKDETERKKKQERHGTQAAGRKSLDDFLKMERIKWKLVGLKQRSSYNTIEG